MVVLDVTIVNIALPVRPGGPRASPTTRANGSSRPTRWRSAPCCFSGGRSATSSGASGPSSPGSVGFAGASALGGAASSFEVLVAARALQGAFARSAGACCAVDRDHHVHRPRGAGQGVRCLRCARDRRRGAGPAARRVPHRAPDLALDDVRESGLRRPRGDRRGSPAGEHAPRRASEGRRARGPARELGALRPGLRILERRDGQLVRSAHRRPAGLRRGRCAGVRRSRAEGRHSPSCRCEWSAIATAARHSWRSRSPASRCSRRSCS